LRVTEASRATPTLLIRANRSLCLATRFWALSSDWVRAPSMASNNPEVVRSAEERAIVASGIDDELSVIIVAPLFLWTALDRSRGWLVRSLSAALMLPIVMNVMILQIRAAFIALLFAIAAVFGFKLGLRRYPLFAVGLGLAMLLLVRYSPDIADTMSDRLRPVMTMDTVEDASVGERTASIDEGLTLASRNWLLGVGPGASVKRHSQTAAHQFEVQEFMEIGVLGLIASTLFSVGVLVMLVRTLARGQDLGVNNTRFALLIGPATFVVYGTFSNPTLNVGYINTWAILIASMVALTPRFEGSSTRLGRI